MPHSPTPLLTMPREHGFWVMLAAAMLSASSAAGWQLEALAVALLSGIAAILFAALLHKAIRRTEWAQLAASTSLALLIVPAELFAGVAPSQVTAHVAAWAGLFTAASLSVRAAFARSRRRKTGGSAWHFSLASILIPAFSAVVLYLHAEKAALAISLVAVAGMLGLAIWRPTAKHLKATGLLLAFIVSVALAADQLY